jgi:hypothetical protein
MLIALCDAVKAHRSLFVKAKILHRDISENNIIITDPKTADGCTGMLIDLDLAIVGAKELAPDIRPGQWNSWPLMCCAESSIPTGMTWDHSSTYCCGSALVMREKESFTAA